MDITLIILIFALFILIIISYSFKSLDFVAISLLCCFSAATIIGLVKGIAIEKFIAYVDFKVIVLILSINIITKIAQDSNILEYVAIKLFKISKGNQKVFFYLLCFISTLLASVFVSDFLVILILGPVVIRLCRYLKINSGTYLIGMGICVNLGGLISPISGGDMVIISSYFKLNPLYYAQYYLIFSLFLIFITIYLMDKLFLAKEPIIDPTQKKQVLDLISTDIMIKNKKMFYINSIAMIITIALFLILPLIYLTAAFSALILIIINKRYTKANMSKMLKDIEWEMIFFFISLYVILGCLLEAGFDEIFKAIPFQEFNPFVLAIILFIICSVLAGLIINVPIALIFIPIVNILVTVYGFPSIILIFALIFGFNIGDNLTPQGSSCNMMVLKTARDSDVKNLEYKRLLKIGAFFTIIHMVLSIGYLYILYFLYG